MTSNEELACVYSSLILFDDDISITAEKLQTILKTANVEIEPYWPTLFAKALEGVDIKGLITNISSGVGSGAPAGAVAAPAAGTFPNQLVTGFCGSNLFGLAVHLKILRYHVND